MQVPELGVFLQLLWSARKLACELGQGNSMLPLFRGNCLYGRAYPIDHIVVSTVRWEQLSLSSTEVLLPICMQITV